MRYTELWSRMDAALGETYASTWADTQVIGSLGGQTVREALDAGYSPQQVWRAVWEKLELPASQR